MQTKSLTIRHIEELPAGSLLYYPEFGDGLLCVSARYEGQVGVSTILVPLSGRAASPYALQALRVDNLTGRAVLVEGARAEVDLSTSTSFNGATIYAAPDGIYVRLRSDRPMMTTTQCLRLDDGVVRSSPPTASVGFTRWRIVMEDDPSEEIWDSDILNTLDSEESLNGR